MVSLPRKENGHLASIPSMKRGRLLCGAVWERQALQKLPALHSKLQGPHTSVPLTFFLQNPLQKIGDQKRFTVHAHSLTPYISQVHLFMQKSQLLHHLLYSRDAITYKITEPPKSDAIKAGTHEQRLTKSTTPQVSSKSPYRLRISPNNSFKFQQHNTRSHPLDYSGFRTRTHTQSDQIGHLRTDLVGQANERSLKAKAGDPYEWAR